jgi:hypothetical protein
MAVLSPREVPAAYAREVLRWAVRKEVQGEPPAYGPEVLRSAGLMAACAPVASRWKAAAYGQAVCFPVAQYAPGARPAEMEAWDALAQIQPAASDVAEPPGAALRRAEARNVAVAAPEAVPDAAEAGPDVAEAAQPGRLAASVLRQAARPSAAPSVDRRVPLPPSLAPRSADCFAHAQRSLRFASRSTRSWQAARDEGLSWVSLERFFAMVRVGREGAGADRLGRFDQRLIIRPHCGDPANPRRFYRIAATGCMYLVHSPFGAGMRARPTWYLPARPIRRD